jgi:hypothetical protein
MDNNQGFSDQKVNMLLNIVSKKMGVSPEVLRKKLEDGSFDNIVKGLSESDVKKLSSLANDPNKVNSILSKPENAQKLNEILGNNNKKR